MYSPEYETLFLTYLRSLLQDAVSEKIAPKLSSSPRLSSYTSASGGGPSVGTEATSYHSLVSTFDAAEAASSKKKIASPILRPGINSKIIAKLSSSMPASAAAWLLSGSATASPSSGGDNDDDDEEAPGSDGGLQSLSRSRSLLSSVPGGASLELSGGGKPGVLASPAASSGSDEATALSLLTAAP